MAIAKTDADVKVHAPDTSRLNWCLRLFSPSLLQSTRNSRARYLLMRIMAFSAAGCERDRHTVLILADIFSAPQEFLPRVCKFIEIVEWFSLPIPSCSKKRACGQVAWFSSGVDYRLLACCLFFAPPSFDTAPRHAGAYWV